MGVEAVGRTASRSVLRWEGEDDGDLVRIRQRMRWDEEDCATTVDRHRSCKISSICFPVSSNSATQSPISTAAAYQC